LALTTQKVDEIGCGHFGLLWLFTQKFEVRKNDRYFERYCDVVALHELRHILVEQPGCTKQRSIYSMSTSKVNSRLSSRLGHEDRLRAREHLSAKDQTVNMQVDALKKASCTKVYTEVMSDRTRLTISMHVKGRRT
jgi:hypothetical protein